MRDPVWRRHCTKDTQKQKCDTANVCVHFSGKVGFNASLYVSGDLNRKVSLVIMLPWLPFQLSCVALVIDFSGLKIAQYLATQRLQFARHKGLQRVHLERWQAYLDSLCAQSLTELVF